MTDFPLATTDAVRQPLSATLHGYLGKFTEAAHHYDGSTHQAEGLEALLGAYSALITDPGNEPGYAQLAATESGSMLAGQLRAQSARCVAILEKYRALHLLNGKTGADGYFANIESCIDEEFGAVAPKAQSKVLLIGSGSFPMTLLNLASRTGATTAGIDIDPEALDLGRQVVQLLGGNLKITLSCEPIEELEFLREATHVVISSTVQAKYQMLHRMHPLTRDDVVVAMRYGDGLKSLFNYPKEPVDAQRWNLAETIEQPQQIFDIALYSKQRPHRKGN